MTTPKAEKGVSTKRPYAYSTNSTKRKCGALPAERIHRLMIRAGWIGPKLWPPPAVPYNIVRPVIW